jgi:hypothetical protein
LVSQPAVVSIVFNGVAFPWLVPRGAGFAAIQTFFAAASLKPAIYESWERLE